MPKRHRTKEIYMKKNKSTILLSVMVLLLCLVALPFTVPSGALLVEADRYYVDNTPEEDFEEEWGEGFGGSMDPSVWEVDKEAVINVLPTDFSPGSPAKEELYTQDGYTDNTISVKMKTEKVEEAVYHVAHIKVAHGSQIRTALAGPFGTKKTSKPSVMAKNNNAIVAINGDYYNQRNGGYIIRQGEVYRKKLQKNLDNLLIDEKGDFHIVRGGDSQGMEEALSGESPIVNAFTFGPALVIDGQIPQMPEKYLFNIHRNEPRAAIGQLGELEYVVVAVDGRSNASTGVTAAQLAQYMKELGCIQAFNLDGGNSATLIFQNDYYNTKSENAERSVSDIIYFSSAQE